jgi:hypothetical protein
LVGHSLLFRELLRRRLARSFVAARPRFAAALAARKLGNAACLAIEVRMAHLS